MCPFFMYFRSSLSQSPDEVEQVDPPEDTKKTKKKKETKVVCVCVHPGAIDTLPQPAPHPSLHTLQAEQSVPAPKKQKEPEPTPESKGKKDKKEKAKEGAQDKEEPPEKGKEQAPKVRLRGTCVPAFCTRVFPVVPDILVPGYTCTRVLYPLVPPCSQCQRHCTALHCRFAALPPWSRGSRAGPVRSQQKVRAVIGRQQVTGLSASRCVFPILFPCHCVYEFSLSPCPSAQVRFQKKLQDLFEMEPARIQAQYRPAGFWGDRKSQGQNRALVAGMFFF